MFRFRSPLCSGLAPPSDVLNLEVTLLPFKFTSIWMGQTWTWFDMVWWKCPCYFWLASITVMHSAVAKAELGLLGANVCPTLAVDNLFLPFGGISDTPRNTCDAEFIYTIFN